MATLLELTIDETGTIENPALRATNNAQSRKPWGAYMCRRGDKVQPISGAFLHRDESKRLDVSRVPVGVVLGFGAEVQTPDGEWQTNRLLYLVLDRDSSSITLQMVSEWEIPANKKLTDPEYAWLLDELGRTASHVKYLQSVVQRLSS